ncbi:MAG: UPF0223 family protein [Erysipelotrichaceae bacterium]|nr:UPF0223 family protein [Erysipelotrichaceae bacterium]
MYDYPLDPSWTTEEIIDVIALYNAVEKAYEEGISREEFMAAYKVYTSIVDSKSMQKTIDREFEEVSTYSIYKVFKAAQENEWIHL